MIYNIIDGLEGPIFVESIKTISESAGTDPNNHGRPGHGHRSKWTGTWKLEKLQQAWNRRSSLPSKIRQADLCRVLESS